MKWREVTASSTSKKTYNRKEERDVERKKEREIESEKEKVVKGKTEAVDRAGEEGRGDQIVSVSGESGGQTDPDTLSRWYSQSTGHARETKKNKKTKKYFYLQMY